MNSYQTDKFIDIEYAKKRLSLLARTLTFNEVLSDITGRKGNHHSVLLYKPSDVLDLDYRIDAEDTTMRVLFDIDFKDIISKWVDDEIYIILNWCKNNFEIDILTEIREFRRKSVKEHGKVPTIYTRLIFSRVKNVEIKQLTRVALNLQLEEFEDLIGCQINLFLSSEDLFDLITDLPSSIL